jgi:HK97 family phage major capsid protein
MDNVQALREKISTLANTAKHMISEKGDQIWSKEEQTKFDNITADIENAKQSIKNIETARALDAENFFNDAKNQANKPNAETISAYDAVALYLRNGTNVSAEQAAAIRNAMSTTTGSEGGFTVPAQVADMVVEAMKAYGGMREVATIITTDNGQNWSYPTSDGTAEVGEIVGQNAGASLGEITFGSVPLNVFTYTSKKIALPLELVQDSAIDVVQFVVNRLGQRLGRKQNSDFTIGGGTTLPNGVIPSATLGKTGATGQTLTVTYDDLVDLLRSVNRAYRGNAVWMLNDLSVGVVSKLKDTTGRPIWTYGDAESITDGNPDTLLGYRVVTNDDVPVMAANARSIAFGDFRKYIIRDVANTSVIKRFDDSAFALNNQVGFCGWQRSGGNLVDAAAVKAYRNSAT